MSATLKDISAEQAVVIRDYFLSSIGIGHTITRKLIEQLPADQMTFQPAGARMSLGELCLHLLATECELLSLIAFAQILPQPSMPEEITTDSLLAWDAEHFPPLLERVTALSGEDLLRTVEFGGLQVSAVGLLQSYLGNTSQTRGQLKVYLQMLIPSLLEPEDGDASGELTDKELATVTGGVVCQVHYSSLTAVQMGWLAPPQGEATLTSVLGGGGAANHIGLLASIFGGSLGYTVGVGLDALAVLLTFI